MLRGPSLSTKLPELSGVQGDQGACVRDSKQKIERKNGFKEGARCLEVLPRAPNFKGRVIYLESKALVTETATRRVTERTLLIQGGCKVLRGTSLNTNLPKHLLMYRETKDRLTETASRQRTLLIQGGCKVLRGREGNL